MGDLVRALQTGDAVVVRIDDIERPAVIVAPASALRSPNYAAVLVDVIMPYGSCERLSVPVERLSLPTQVRGTPTHNAGTTARHSSTIHLPSHERVRSFCCAANTPLNPRPAAGHR